MAFDVSPVAMFIPIIKSSLEICLVVPKERIVTLKVAELSVLDCLGLQLWLAAQHTLFCRKINFVASNA